MGNKTAVAEDQVSSQNVHNAQQINQADNNPEQTAQTEPKSSPLSLKVKLIISAVVIVMLAGLGVGIYFIVDHFSPKIRVQKSSAFSFPDRTNIVVHKVRVTDINVKQDNQNLTLFVVSTGRSGSGRRLQQVDYDVFIKDHGSGLTIRRPTIKGGFGGKVQFLLSPGLFLNAIDQEDQARMLQTDVSAPMDANLQAEYAEIETNLLSTLNDLFSDAIEEYTDDIVTFKEKRYQTYRLADGEFKLQPAPAHARLLVKVKKGGRKKMKKAVTPAVQTVQNNGAAIGQAVGGVAKAAVGAITGGPAGIIGTFGSIAQNLLQSCFPEDTDTFSCQSVAGALESYPLFIGETVSLATDIDTINRAIEAN